MLYPEREMDVGPEQITPKKQPSIQRPNINNEKAFEKWLDKYVHRPFIGTEDKRHPDGTPLSLDEQIELTREQLRKVRVEWKTLGRSDKVISDILVTSVIGLADMPDNSD